MHLILSAAQRNDPPFGLEGLRADRPFRQSPTSFPASVGSESEGDRSEKIGLAGGELEKALEADFR